MKKLLLGLAVVVVIAAIGAGSWFYLSPDQAARRAIEHVGNQAIQAGVHADSVQISPADGTGLITGYSVSNPRGFKAPAAFSAKSIKLTVELLTMDRDPIVVRTLSVASPRITYERSQAGSNFEVLLENIKRNPDQPGRRIIVDRVIIYFAKLSYASPTDAGQTITVDLPEIRLSSIGRIEGGATSRKLAMAIVEALLYHIKRAIPSGALGRAP